MDRNRFDELMKHLTLATFFKKLTEMPTSAFIEYKIDDKGIVSAHREGRTVELELLTALIIKDRIEKGAKDCGEKYIDIYFDFMKEIIPLLDKFGEEINEPDKSDIDAIKKFNDLFKDLGL